MADSLFNGKTLQVQCVSSPQKVSILESLSFQAPNTFKNTVVSRSVGIPPTKQCRGAISIEQPARKRLWPASGEKTQRAQFYKVTIPPLASIKQETEAGSASSKISLALGKTWTHGKPLTAWWRPRKPQNEC